jgi:hypothetical protein
MTPAAWPLILVALMDALGQSVDRDHREVPHARDRNRHARVCSAEKPASSATQGGLPI